MIVVEITPRTRQKLDEFIPKQGTIENANPKTVKVMCFGNLGGHFGLGNNLLITVAIAFDSRFPTIEAS